MRGRDSHPSVIFPHYKFFEGLHGQSGGYSNEQIRISSFLELTFSLGDIYPRFSHILTALFLLELNNSPLDVWMYHTAYLSIHLLKDILSAPMF